ncbi:MAG: hypothetical protein U0263_20005 [Polyangiaceae bacterium]
MRTYAHLTHLILGSLIVSGCAVGTSGDPEGKPAFCDDAQSCFEFCLCATGEPDRCFSTCNANQGSGGGSGLAGGQGGATNGAGASSGGGGTPGAGGTTQATGGGGSPSGGGGAGAGGSGSSSGAGGTTSTGPTCAGQCGSSTPVSGSCYCDPECVQFGDCCPDFAALCNGAGSGGATGAGGGGGTPNLGNCGSWPTGAAGVAQGKTLPSNLSWQGFREGSSSATSVSIADYYDCDGTKGINAILFITAQTSCGVCKSEAAQLEAKMASWSALGIKVVTLMISGGVNTAQAWKNQYGLTKSAVLADKMPPSLAYTNYIGTPMHHIVNPRTMQVVYTQMGAGGSAFSQLEQLAQQNKK